MILLRSRSGPCRDDFEELSHVCVREGSANGTFTCADEAERDIRFTRATRGGHQDADTDVVDIGDVGQVQRHQPWHTLEFRLQGLPYRCGRSVRQSPPNADHAAVDECATYLDMRQSEMVCVRVLFLHFALHETLRLAFVALLACAADVTERASMSGDQSYSGRKSADVEAAIWANLDLYSRSPKRHIFYAQRQQTLRQHGADLQLAVWEIGIELQQSAQQQSGCGG